MITDVADGVIRILAPNPGLLTGEGTNTYLLSSQGECIVVDPGPHDEGHIKGIVEAARERGSLKAILVTHGHPDHDAGAVRLRALTGAPVLAWSYDGVADADAALEDGAATIVGARRILALHTPGHRFDHLCFLIEGEGVLFAGDLIAGTGTIVIAPPEGDLSDYMASLRRLRALDLTRLLPAHGQVVEDPGALLDYYIAHREEREHQVAAALADGDTTVDGMVARIYAAIDPALHPAAALSLTAHLLKLAREGRARHDPTQPDGQGWTQN